MIISRRPKKYASSEKAPGPKSAIAAAIAITLIPIKIGAVWFVATDKMPKEIPAVKTMAPIIGVRNPTRKNIPTTIVKSPVIQFKNDKLTISDKYTVPRNNAVRPRAVRKINNP